MRHRRLELLVMLAAALPSPDAAAHAWSPGPGAPPGLGPRMTRITYDAARRRIVLFGGKDGGGFKNDTWEYDGAAWTQGPAAPAGLTPRNAPALAFDSVRGRIVLFGGQDGSTRDDTWLYDGAAWTAGPAAPVGMSARTESEMAFDLRRGRMVLFGGDAAGNGSGTLDDTWELDGAGWSAGPAAPPALVPRTAHGLAYDEAHGVTVLFGGFDGTGLLDDTWLYDGAAWTPGPAAPPGLTPRSTQLLAYASRTRRVVMFAGFDGIVYVNETWEWDGTRWSPGSAAPAGLERRCFHGLAYDDARGVAVVFGGFDPPSYYYNDTWEYAAGHHFVVGAGLGAPNPNRVSSFEGDATPTTVDFLAYSASSWGVVAACASVDAGTEEEILTGPGPGPVHGPQVRGFRWDGGVVAKINFYAYGTLRYGVNSTGQEVDGDLAAEPLTGAGPGEVFGPHVRGFDYDGISIRPIASLSFYAYGTLRYGANVSGGDLDGDGDAEILTGPGPGPTFSPTVRGFDHAAGGTQPISKINFQAFAAPEYGVNVAGGSVDADAFAEIATTPGPGPMLPSRFLAFDYDGVAVAAAPGFTLTRFATVYGGRVGLGGVASTARLDLLAAPGRDPAAAALVESWVYDGSTLAPAASFTAFAGYSHGANPTGGLGAE